ncbi:MAG: SpoIIE family protein phosphatase, partial [Candidatus Omnitrophota bacterium]
MHENKCEFFGHAGIKVISLILSALMLWQNVVWSDPDIANPRASEPTTRNSALQVYTGLRQPETLVTWNLECILRSSSIEKLNIPVLINPFTGDRASTDDDITLFCDFSGTGKRAIGEAWEVDCVLARKSDGKRWYYRAHIADPGNITARAAERHEKNFDAGVLGALAFDLTADEIIAKIDGQSLMRNAGIVQRSLIRNTDFHEKLNDFRGLLTRKVFSEAEIRLIHALVISENTEGDDGAYALAGGDAPDLCPDDADVFLRMWFEYQEAAKQGNNRIRATRLHRAVTNLRKALIRLIKTGNAGPDTLRAYFHESSVSVLGRLGESAAVYAIRGLSGTVNDIELSGDDARFLQALNSVMLGREDEGVEILFGNGPLDARLPQSQAEKFTGAFEKYANTEGREVFQTEYFMAMNALRMVARQRNLEEGFNRMALSFEDSLKGFLEKRKSSLGLLSPKEKKLAYAIGWLLSRMKDNGLDQADKQRAITLIQSDRAPIYIPATIAGIYALNYERHAASGGSLLSGTPYARAVIALTAELSRDNPLLADEFFGGSDLSPVESLVSGLSRDKRILLGQLSWQSTVEHNVRQMRSRSFLNAMADLGQVGADRQGYANLSLLVDNRGRIITDGFGGSRSSRGADVRSRPLIDSGRVLYAGCMVKVSERASGDIFVIVLPEDVPNHARSVLECATAILNSQCATFEEFNRSVMDSEPAPPPAWQVHDNIYYRLLKSLGRQHIIDDMRMELTRGRILGKDTVSHFRDRLKTMGLDLKSLWVTGSSVISPEHEKIELIAIAAGDCKYRILRGIGAILADGRRAALTVHLIGKNDARSNPDLYAGLMSAKAINLYGEDSFTWLPDKDAQLRYAGSISAVLAEGVPGPRAQDDREPVLPPSDERIQELITLAACSANPETVRATLTELEAELFNLSRADTQYLGHVMSLAEHYKPLNGSYSGDGWFCFKTGNRLIAGIIDASEAGKTSCLMKAKALLLIREHLRSLADTDYPEDFEKKLAAALSVVNNLLCEFSKNRKYNAAFVTAEILAIDLSCNGNMPHYYIPIGSNSLHVDGRLQERLSGSVLGLSPNQTFADKIHKDVTFAPGSWFCFLTDGVYEARNASGNIGLEPLTEAMASPETAEPRRIVDAVNAKLREQGYSFRDDSTILAGRWNTLEVPGLESKIGRAILSIDARLTSYLAEPNHDNFDAAQRLYSALPVVMRLGRTKNVDVRQTADITVGLMFVDTGGVLPDKEVPSESVISASARESIFVMIYDRFFRRTHFAVSADTSLENLFSLIEAAAHELGPDVANVEVIVGGGSLDSSEDGEFNDKVYKNRGAVISRLQEKGFTRIRAYYPAFSDTATELCFDRAGGRDILTMDLAPCKDQERIDHLVDTAKRPLGLGTGFIFGRFWQDVIVTLHVRFGLSNRAIAALGGIEELVYSLLLVSVPAIIGNALFGPAGLLWGGLLGSLISMFLFAADHWLYSYKLIGRRIVKERSTPNDRRALILFSMFQRPIYYAILTHMTGLIFASIVGLIVAACLHSFYNCVIAPRFGTALAMAPAPDENLIPKSGQGISDERLRKIINHFSWPTGRVMWDSVTKHTKKLPAPDNYRTFMRESVIPALSTIYPFHLRGENISVSCLLNRAKIMLLDTGSEGIAIYNENEYVFAYGNKNMEGELFIYLSKATVDRYMSDPAKHRFLYALIAELLIKAHFQGKKSLSDIDEWVSQKIIPSIISEPVPQESGSQNALSHEHKLTAISTLLTAARKSLSFSDGSGRNMEKRVREFLRLLNIASDMDDMSLMPVLIKMLEYHNENIRDYVPIAPFFDPDGAQSAWRTDWMREIQLLDEKLSRAISYHVAKRAARHREADSMVIAAINKPLQSAHVVRHLLAAVIDAGGRVPDEELIALKSGLYRTERCKIFTAAKKPDARRGYLYDLRAVAEQVIDVILAIPPESLDNPEVRPTEDQLTAVRLMRNFGGARHTFALRDILNGEEEALAKALDNAQKLYLVRDMLLKLGETHGLGLDDHHWFDGSTTEAGILTDFQSDKFCYNPSRLNAIARYLLPFFEERADGNLAVYRMNVLDDPHGAQERNQLKYLLTVLHYLSQTACLMRWAKYQGQLIRAALRRKLYDLTPGHDRYTMNLYFGGTAKGAEIIWAINEINGMLAEDGFQRLRGNLTLNIYGGDIRTACLCEAEQSVREMLVQSPPISVNIETYFEWMDLTDPRHLTRLGGRDIDCFFMLNTYYLNNTDVIALRKWRQLFFKKAIDTLVAKMKPGA